MKTNLARRVQLIKFYLVATRIKTTLAQEVTVLSIPTCGWHHARNIDSSSLKSWLLDTIRLRYNIWKFKCRTASRTCKWKEIRRQLSPMSSILCQHSKKWNKLDVNNPQARSLINIKHYVVETQVQLRDRGSSFQIALTHRKRYSRTPNLTHLMLMEHTPWEIACLI